MFTSRFLWGCTLVFVTSVAAVGHASTDDIPAAPLPGRDSSMTDASATRDTASTTDEAPAQSTPDDSSGKVIATPVSNMTESLAAPAGDGTKPPACKKPPANPYKGVYYDNNISYLDDPDNDYFYLGDSLKRLHFSDCAVLDVGGEFRLRQHDEHILNRSDNFLLQRTRLYGDLHVEDWFRTYVEAIDAYSSWGHLTPRTSELNRFDALNLFADARVLDDDQGAAWLRGGRQELLYGNQRLISPLDWSNTRRTFDGAKLFWQGKDWNVDGFWTRPVPFSQHVTTDDIFDHSDPNAEFYGLYATNKATKNRTIDTYYLGYSKYDGAVPFRTQTLGGRYLDSYENWLCEIEAAYQFGSYGARDHSAGFYTLGAGRKLASCGWNPVFWAYYDWASGDPTPGVGVHETFNQLFPLGHKYFGYMDLVGRQNIEDLNFQLTMNPDPTVEFLVWWHIFHLQQARDALYDATGTAIRQDITGAAGSDVGEELDLTLRWTFRPRADVLFGYSHLFPGQFLVQTGGAPGQDFYYTQFSLRF